MDPYMSRLGSGIFYHTGISNFMDEIDIMNATAKNNNIQITSGLLNPFGAQPEYGSNEAMDAEGAATVGGVNTPPLSDRTGYPTGKGTALSDMSSTQLNAAIGVGIGVLQGLLGKEEDDCDSK